MQQVYPLSAVRALVLHAQRLTTANGAESRPTPDVMGEVVAQVGCVQVDTICVVHRSHYLALWSRLGSYDLADFDRLVYGDPDASENPRRLFEGWMHAASILALSEYRYRIPHQRRLRATPAPMSEQWLAKPESEELMQGVLERIRREGALGVKDFQYDGPKRDSWWDWRPAKNALVHLFAWGELMVADRVNFQQIYDLRERVLPAWVDTTEPTREEMIRHTLELAVRAFGVCRPIQAADLSHEIKRGTARPFVEQLMEEGVLVQVRAELHDGRKQAMVVHREDLPLLEQAADGALPAERTTFLSPFDSLFWPQRRDRELWGFHQALEAYKPAEKRQWGYFCLPILHKDRLVGRLDPKLERQSRTLRLKALYLEPGVEPGEELVAGVAAAMRDFSAFHGADDLVVESSEPAEFRERLVASLE